MLSTLTICGFTGSALKTYLPGICRLRIEIFREYPYLDDGILDHEMAYFKHYPNCSEAIAIIVFDGSRMVGASTGIPLEYEEEEAQQPFLLQSLDPASFFFFSESVLLKEYRGRGVGHHFFDLREDHARRLNKFTHTCFCFIDTPEDDPKKPTDYLPLNHFWRKRGYIPHPEINVHADWKEIGETEKSSKKMNFWIKNL